MAGLVPAIHVLNEKKEDVDARHKAGHDGLEVVACPASAASGER
jgi:hypothetical protein